MFTTLRKASEVCKAAADAHYLFERIEKSGLPSLISEASERGEFSIRFDWGAVLPRWDQSFATRVANTLRDYGYVVNDPKSSIEFMEISLAESKDDNAEVEDDDYL